VGALVIATDRLGGVIWEPVEAPLHPDRTSKPPITNSRQTHPIAFIG